MQQIDVAGIEGDNEPKTIAAEVLVVGPDDWATSDAAAQLRAAGRVVHRCSDSGEAPFPCNAMIPGRGCPLDLHEVDVVLNIRTRSGQPTMAEMGAVCGLRDGLPLVVAGMSEVSGFAPLAFRVPIDGDVVSSCDEAVRRHD